ncbi:MAG: hypothetical protein EAX87_12955 [Candidatus Thorarchaeota archaeon]|nr:hypothetical protein [Candidatus Thorarchaeota archaeon]
MTAIGTLPITMGHGMDGASSGNNFLISEFSILGQELTEQTDSMLTMGSHKVISSFINRSFAEIVIEVDPVENNNYSAELAAIPGYPDDTAYEMVNVDKSHNWIDKINMPNPGQGVTAAIVDTGVHAHEDLMYRPDGTLRTMWYIDINWYYEGFWPFGHYVYQAWNFFIDSEDDWTSYSVYEHDSTQMLGVYDGRDHGTGTVGTFLRMAPYVDLIVVDYKDTNQRDFAYEWALGLLNSWHDPDIVSCSWGFNNGWTGLQNAVDNLVSDGETVMIASSGNYQTSVYYPAKYANVMAIGAVYTRDEPDEGEMTWYSNYGPEIEVVAPGTYVYAPIQNDEDDNGHLDDFGDCEGTSFSAPLVAGEAAMTYQLLSNARGSNPSSSVVKDFLKYHCDPGGQDTDPDDYSWTGERQNDYYGHGIIDSWETLSFACLDDFQDYDTNSWGCHPITTANGPRFDPYLYQGKMYMTDSSGDKVVAYQWTGLGIQKLRVNPDYDKYFSFYTKRSNGYALAYHDFYPVYQAPNNYVKVRFYGKYLQVYRMYQGSSTKLYEEDVFSHTGWWCYDWQQVEIHIYYEHSPSGYYLKLRIARRADGQTYTSAVITLAGPIAYNTLYMQGPVVCAFRGGWASGNYGYALWDEIRVSQVPSGGLLG